MLDTKEWKSLQQKKTRRSKLDVSKLYVRYKPRKNGKHTMMIYIGNDIMARMDWQVGTLLDILRHESRHTQFVITQCMDGAKISRGDRAHAGLVQIVTDKSYPFDDDKSVPVYFMEYYGYVMFDIGQPILG